MAHAIRKGVTLKVGVVSGGHSSRQVQHYALHLLALFLLTTSRSASLAATHPQSKASIQMTRGLQEQQLIDDLLAPHRYDWRIRPFGNNKSEPNGGPVRVSVNIYLRTISKVDDVNMEYSAHFTFREEWCDERLKYNSSLLKYIHLTPQQQIWMPDTFFQNEKDGRSHNIDKPNVLLRVQNASGCILYSVRLTLMLSCPMNLQNYPLDTQECYLDLASYAYTTNDIIYYWKGTDPIQIKAGLRSSLPSFSLNKVDVGLCTSKTNTGEYSCLRLILVLKREFSYYLLQLYIPSFMLVAVSWVSFWLDKDSVPARVTLGVTTLLTMSTQASGINAKLPPVSYTKAIDVWIGVCLAFIFGALLEFALVNYAARRDMLEDIQRRRRAERSDYPEPAVRPLLSEPLIFETWDRRSASPRGYQSPISDLRRHDFLPKDSGRWCRKRLVTKYWRLKYRERSKRIDVLSRVVFPFTFLVFNLIYWANYLTPYLQVTSESSVGL